MTVDIHCKFPLNYPTVIPHVEVEVVKGIGKTQLEEIYDIIQKTSQDNIGSPSIFMIVENVKDWLLDNNFVGQDGSMYADMLRTQQQKDIEIKKKAERIANAVAAEQENNKNSENPEELERIRKRQAGHPVTIDSFIAWKEKFDLELLNLQKQKSGGQIDHLKEDDRPTGKQLFMMNKAGVEDALIEEGEKELPGEEEGEDTILKSDKNAHEDDDEEDEDYIDEEDDNEDEG